MSNDLSKDLFKTETDPALAHRYLLLTILTSAGLLAVTVLYPFRMDNNVYQTMGFVLVRYGKLPYMGSWDMNFPGIAFIHAFSILLFGNNELGFRSLDAIVHCAMVIMVFQLLRRFLSVRTAFFVAFIVCIYALSRRDWSAGQRDGFASFFVIAATVLLYRLRAIAHADRISRRSTWLVVLSICIGLLTASAISIRPTFGLFGVVIAIALWKFIPSHRWLVLFFFAIGVLLLFGAILLPYAMTPNGLRELYLATIRFNLDVYGTSRYRNPYSVAFFESSELFVNATLLFAMVVFLLRKRWRRMGATSRITTSDAVLFLAYYLSARLSVIVMGKFFRYQYEMLFILTAVLLAFTLHEILSWQKSVAVRKWSHISVGVLLAGVIYPWGPLVYFVQGLFHSSDLLEFTRAKMAQHEDWDRDPELAVTRYVAGHTSPTDRVEFFCTDPYTYWRAEREPASRFTMVYSLVVQQVSGGFTDYQLRWRREFLESLRSPSAKMIVIAEKPDSLANFAPHSPLFLINAIPGFDNVLAQNFTRDTTIGCYEVYRRRDS